MATSVAAEVPRGAELIYASEYEVSGCARADALDFLAGRDWIELNDAQVRDLLPERDINAEQMLESAARDARSEEERLRRRSREWVDATREYIAYAQARGLDTSAARQDVIEYTERDAAQVVAWNRKAEFLDRLPRKLHAFLIAIDINVNSKSRSFESNVDGATLELVYSEIGGRAVRRKGAVVVFADRTFETIHARRYLDDQVADAGVSEYDQRATARERLVFRIDECKQRAAVSALAATDFLQLTSEQLEDLTPGQQFDFSTTPNLKAYLVRATVQVDGGEYRAETHHGTVWLSYAVLTHSSGNPHDVALIVFLSEPIVELRFSSSMAE